MVVEMLEPVYFIYCYICQGSASPWTLDEDWKLRNAVQVRIVCTELWAYGRSGIWEDVTIGQPALST